MNEFENKQTLGFGERQKIDAYRRAANYLSVGQIHWLVNPLLHVPPARLQYTA